MSAHTSPFTKRFRQKLGELGFKHSLEDASDIRAAFVAALKEEVEARYGPSSGTDANYNVPLRIAGLGSFKMKTRPARAFDSFRYAQNKSVFGNDGPRETVMKPPARRLAFTSKWEEIK